MVKKLLSAAAIVGALSLPILALADSMTTGVQPQSGTITAWSASTEIYGDYSVNTSQVYLKINGVQVDEVDCPGSCTASDTVDIAYSSGDDIEISTTDQYGRPGTILSYSLTATLTPVIPEVGALMVLPTGTAPTITNTMSGQLSDNGTIQFLALAFGIPLSFFIFHAILGLFPSVRRYRKKHGYWS